MGKTKNFSIIPLFHPPSILYPLTFPSSQLNGPLMAWQRFVFNYYYYFTKLFVVKEEQRTFINVWHKQLVLPYKFLVKFKNGRWVLESKRYSKVQACTSSVLQWGQQLNCLNKVGVKVNTEKTKTKNYSTMLNKKGR